MRVRLLVPAVSTLSSSAFGATLGHTSRSFARRTAAPSFATNARGAANSGDDASGVQEVAEVAVGPEINADGAAWGGAALHAARHVLEADEWAGLRLFSFSAVPSGRLNVRLDKLDDRHGSPSLKEVEGFARALGKVLEAELGEETMCGIEVEVSSPVGFR
jgi:hypothetical protein